MTDPTPVPQQLTPPGGWRNPGRVRVPPLSPDEASLALKSVIKLVNKLGGLEASNLFLMLMRNFRLFRGWLGFAARMMPFGEIERRDTELVILRVGWNCRARYEWGQHVDIGLRHGVSARDVARIPEGAAGFADEPRIAALLAACDEFHHDRMIAEPTWQQLTQHYDTRLLLEVVMLIGHYEMLAGVLNSTGLQLEPRLENILAEAPIHQRTD